MNGQGAKNRFLVAITATLALHAFVLILMSFQPVRSGDGSRAEFIAVEFADDGQLDEIKEQTMESLIQDRLNERVANLAANEHSQRTEDRRSSSSQEDIQELEASVDAELRALEKAEFERLAAEKKEFDLEGVPDDGAQGQIQTLSEWDKRYDGQVTVSYDLDGRMHRKLPVPGYRCKVAGSVSIIIKVTSQGRVIHAKIASVQLASPLGDEGMISDMDDCIASAALESAQASSFEAVEGDASMGTLIYRFLAQD
jgi:hypothetical protein